MPRSRGREHLSAHTHTSQVTEARCGSDHRSYYLGVCRLAPAPPQLSRDHTTTRKQASKQCCHGCCAGHLRRGRPGGGRSVRRHRAGAGHGQRVGAVPRVLRRRRLAAAAVGRGPAGVPAEPRVPGDGVLLLVRAGLRPRRHRRQPHRRRAGAHRRPDRRPHPLRPRRRHTVLLPRSRPPQGDQAEREGLPQAAAGHQPGQLRQDRGAGDEHDAGPALQPLREQPQLPHRLLHHPLRRPHRIRRRQPQAPHPSGQKAGGGAAGRGVGAGRGDPGAAVRARADASGELRRRGGGGDGAYLPAEERAGHEGDQRRRSRGGARAGARGADRGEHHRRRPILASLRPHARGDPQHRLRHGEPRPGWWVLPPGCRRPHRQRVAHVVDHVSRGSA